VLSTKELKEIVFPLDIDNVLRVSLKESVCESVSDVKNVELAFLNVVYVFSQFEVKALTFVSTLDAH